MLAAKGGDSSSLVVLHIEDRIELGDLQQVVHFFGQMQQLQFPALVADGGEGADQFADAGAVDVAGVAEVEQDFFGSFGEDFVDAVAQGDAAFAKGDAATEVGRASCRERVLFAV